MYTINEKAILVNFASMTCAELLAEAFELLLKLSPEQLVAVLEHTEIMK